MKALRILRTLARRTLLPVHYPLQVKCFSQEGEDLIVDRLLETALSDRPGYYVDVGAHHPFRYSNTFRLYLKGWSGINIDAMPGSMEPFRRHRPRDVNIEAAISQEPQDLTYYIFSEPALNGFAADLAESRRVGCEILRKIPIRTRRLSDLLSENLPPGQTIDFLTIDVEGLDLEVLHSNDWSRFRPAIIMAEDVYAKNIQDSLACPITRFLTANGYEFISKLVNTMVFRSFGSTHD